METTGLLDGRKRENPEVTEALEARLARYKYAKIRAQRMATLRDHPAWPEVRGALQEKIDLVNSQLNTFIEYPERQRDVMLQQRIDFTAMLSMIEDVDGNLGRFDTEIAKLEKQIGSRKPAR